MNPLTPDDQEPQDEPQGDPAPLPIDPRAAEDMADARRTTREAMDRLNESNRILQESRMTDRSKPLTDQQTATIRERFVAYTDLHGIPMTTVARQVGYSSSVISEWLAGKYSGNREEVSHALNDWLERDARRSAARRPQNYVSTWVAEDIRTVAILADKRTMMAAIVVPSGGGKTFVLKALTEEMRGLYVYCTRHLTQREFLMTLALALGLGRRSRQGTKAELHRFIVESLTGTHRIIFLDEAHQLGATINCVRAIHDEAHVPIVMAGTVEILTFANDRSDGRGQFSSRTIFYNALDNAINAEGGGGGSRDGGATERRRDLFTVEEVRQFFDSKKIRLNKDALQMLWLLACLPNWGCLRLIENTVETVFEIDPQCEVVTRDHVVTAVRMLHGRNAALMERLTRQHLEMSRTVARAG